MKSYLRYLQSIQTPLNFQRKLDYINHNFSKYVRRQDFIVLEIGPGLGEFVSFLNQKDIKNIDIVDQDKDILNYIQKKFKVRNTILGDVSSVKLTQKYDLIFLLQVLEHLPKKEFPTFISSIYKQLNEHGQIIITVPNGGNPFSLVERYSDLTHTILFTENSLRELPNYCGLPGSASITIKPYSIPPVSIINITRIIFQKVLHFLILTGLVINGGVYSKILTPNISLIITKNK